MQIREIQVPASDPRPVDLILRTGPQWTSIFFFAGLGMLHLTIGSWAFAHRHWEGYMSIGLGTFFVTASLIAYRCRFEMAILGRQHRIRLRSGMKRIHYQRFIAFSAVRGVRLTLSQPSDESTSLLEVLCGDEDIECPPTTIPRQEALWLAMRMNVPLIKVMTEARGSSRGNDRFREEE